MICLWICKFYCTLVLCWLLWVAGGDVGDALAWALISCPWYLLYSSQVACHAPPCAWLPSLPALHLLGAWPAPCCLWSCLCNHVYWLWLWVLVWWGQFTLDAQLMSRENLVSVLCWCWGVGAVVLVMLVLWCWWCWLTRVLGRPVSHTVLCFILPPKFWCLDTSLHAFDDHAAC
jgi:hypothetical protein